MTHPFITACVSALFSISTPATDSTYTIAMVGDIMMGGTLRGGMQGETLMPKERLPKNDGLQLFADAMPTLRKATLALGNCEGVLADGGRSAKDSVTNAFAFRTPTRLAPRLSEAGFDFLSLANNHSFDYGTAGLRSTQNTLQAHGIAFAGTKENITGQSFAIVKRNGIRFGICAFGHNPATLSHLEDNTVLHTLQTARKACDILIVTFHGGAEGSKASRLPHGKELYFNENRGNLRRFAHLAIRSGADLVFGHGPHVPRAIELYEGRLIAYSLGNFCTPFGMNLTGTSGLAPLLEAKLDRNGHFVSGRIHSFRQVPGIGPRHDKTHAAAKEIARLSAIDIVPSALKIDADGTLTLLHGTGKPLIQK